MKFIKGGLLGDQAIFIFRYSDYAAKNPKVENHFPLLMTFLIGTTGNKLKVAMFSSSQTNTFKFGSDPPTHLREKLHHYYGTNDIRQAIKIISSLNILHRITNK